MTDGGWGPRSARSGVRPDGGREESNDDRVEEVEVELDETRGGFISRVFPGRDPRVRSLRQQLAEEKTRTQQLRTRLQELESRVQEIERANEALEETKASYEQRQFRMDALLESVGRSFDQASDELADYGVAVGDLDITLHADVSGGGQRDTLDLRLVGSDEEIDPERLSTVSFSVGRRGRLRHYGPSGGQATGGGAGPLTSSTPPGAEESESDEGSERDEGAESDAETETPTDGPAEVPSVSGLDAEEATQKLVEAGFETHIEYRPDETPAGTVVEQWPRAFAVAPRNSSIVLFVGGTEGP